MPPAVPKHSFQEKEKEKDVRGSNIAAARGVADAIRTSLGPRGMDKMICSANGEVIITNDGATIMEQLDVGHPTAKMMVELSKAQDVEAGDGTTSVVVLAGSILSTIPALMAHGIHPTVVAESFQKAKLKGLEILREIAVPVKLDDKESLIKNATTSLNSKVVAQNSSLLAPLAVEAVLKVVASDDASNVDLRNIKVINRVGGTVDDTELVPGLVFPQAASHAAGGPSKVANCKIGLIQFQLSSPKTNMDNSVVIKDYTQMDRILKEERNYILKMCKKIKSTGCNVLLIQKSILRDAVNELSLHFLAKMKILVVKDVERSDIEFISKTIKCIPIASIEGFTADKLGKADLAEEVPSAEGRFIKITGVPSDHTVSILCRGSNRLVVEEVNRSVHDALCVVRSLVKERYLIPGGGAPEMELSLKLAKYAQTLSGIESHCVRAYAEAFEIIPYTLAENAGLSPIEIVTQLRNRHVEGNTYDGINVRKGVISNILDQNVVQPLLVSTSALSLATEMVAMLLKIDDFVICR